MKLNKKNTILIGFAFLSICAFWQMYDGLIPKILKETFALPESVSGYIMAADNVLALFLLPIFGGLSDRSKSKLGRRRPYILVGTIAAVSFMMLLPVLDNSYFAVPATAKLIAFIIVLGLVLVAMGIYRSPAVALMPDVTPKPLRSKGNAVINLMGAIGGILYLVVTSVLYSESKTAGLTHINYLPLFIIVGAVMLVALLILMFFVNEPKLAAEQLEYEAAHPEQELTVAVNDEKAIMPKAVKKSLIFMLFSIALWFIGYNGITTWFTTYAKAVWDMDIGAASTCLTIATAGAIVSYIPVGSLASKIGRKKTIKAGVLLLALCFAGGFAFTILFNSFNPLLYILFALVGVAWAAINVNSLPMVVEMCSGSNIGKFTGLYYTFSMAAQIVTPIAAGYLIENIDYKVLFLYSAVFVMLSFVTMCFVKHGDNKPEVNKDLLENFNFED
ncbi:MAG: MFS transporter [Clostridia bacterium]|nr:MFS transporter [Clostridia bacterium]